MRAGLCLPPAPRGVASSGAGLVLEHLRIEDGCLRGAAKDRRVRLECNRGGAEGTHSLWTGLNYGEGL